MKTIQLALLFLLPLAACERAPEPSLAPLPELRGAAAAATPRVDGRVGTPDATRPPIISYAEGVSPAVAAGVPGTGPAAGPGEFSLDFADTDIREVVAQILGTMLRVTYTIDPGVKGSVTLRTARPIARAELLPTLQALLAQNNAVLAQSGSLYRVGPAGGGAGGGAQATPGTGGIVVPLRFAGAEDLARVLQPYVGQGGKVIPDPGRNALLVAAEGEARDSLLTLIQAFDTDILAGQSYALLPVSAGGVKDFATALQEAFRGQAGGQGGGSLAGLVRVVPMERINSVLVVSAQRDYIAAARRIYDTLDKARRQNLRSWYVHYLQNGQANDLAYLLQQAFTPNNVTATPGNRGGGGRGGIQATTGLGGGMGGGGMGAGGLSGGGGGSGGLGSGGSGSGGLGGSSVVAASAGGGAPAGAQGGAAPSNPLLGGLDVLGVGGGGPAAQAEGMRIVPNESNNAVLIYATLSEYDTVKAMLRKIDILPLQVRIDATIAEVTLNDNLKYGTQFFFKGGGINGILSYAVPPVTAANIAANLVPGFVLGGSANGTSAALSALQAVTQVRVLSSPQLMVLDNQSAKLQVGSLVPYLSQTAQGTIVPNAPIINSVNYQQTGVIMQITPRVNSGGLVTLDIAQEVSEVDPNAGQASGSGINSPTFQNRNVISRVVVQDGQTIGLAGLIRDSASTGNDGIPLLKDIPWLGSLAGRQSNTRARTELIVLITPHVMHDQRDARALTQDLREGLVNAALVPQDLRRLPPSGSSDPGAPARRAIRRPQ